jgi:hypothetical protein
MLCTPVGSLSSWGQAWGLREGREKEMGGMHATSSGRPAPSVARPFTPSQVRGIIGACMKGDRPLLRDGLPARMENYDAKKGNPSYEVAHVSTACSKCVASAEATHCARQDAGEIVCNAQISLGSCYVTTCCRRESSI